MNRWTVGILTGNKVYYYDLKMEDLSPLPFNLHPTADSLYMNFDTVVILAVL